ncbi:MAG: molybdopterin-dependent oxidoreductase, partial [Candidatus Marinimicrobia bacterium]|nr:molybdopterin-dependent oxidoreductase [Candidatus Neomarinimicrobiota bacterium]
MILQQKNGHNYFVELTVNGDQHMVLVSAKTTLVEVLREQLGLTGTKLGCGVGDCGACTILLDGEPANACLLLALEAEGRDIITIEGISINGELHPIQRAFVNEGAIQCGFCTPAMVLTGKALVNKNADPSEKEVREALAGTFCRCTGYAKIVKAIRNWQHYNEMPSSKEEGEKTELAVVGKSLPRKDSFEKVTGRARYTDDIHLPNMLYGKILTSPFPHARILNIDTQKAEVLQGVKAILTWKNVPDILYGVSPARYDEHILAKEKVCYIGDEVAAVAAIDEETCQKALDLIEVEYEELPAVFDPIEAMKDGAPLILERYPNNINTRVDWNFGDVEKGFEEADLVLSDTYVGNRTYQSPMEPHCAIAEWNSDDRLTLYTSTQVVHYVRYQLS